MHDCSLPHPLWQSLCISSTHINRGAEQNVLHWYPHSNIPKADKYGLNSLIIWTLTWNPTEVSPRLTCPCSWESLSRTSPLKHNQVHEPSLLSLLPTKPSEKDEWQLELAARSDWKIQGLLGNAGLLLMAASGNQWRLHVSLGNILDYIPHWQFYMLLNTVGLYLGTMTAEPFNTTKVHINRFIMLCHRLEGLRKQLSSLGDPLPTPTCTHGCPRKQSKTVFFFFFFNGWISHQ